MPKKEGEEEEKEGEGSVEVEEKQEGGRGARIITRLTNIDNDIQQD